MWKRTMVCKMPAASLCSIRPLNNLHSSSFAEEDEDIMGLIEKCNSNMVACCLCDKIIGLEYREMEGHMTQQHRLPMHRYLKMFYAKIEEDLEYTSETTRPPPPKKTKHAIMTTEVKTEPKDDLVMDIITISDSDDD